jgi:hypothetical protein
MASRIDNVEAVLRLESHLDIGRFDCPSHHTKVYLFRLNEVENLAGDDVLEIEYDVRPDLAKA